MKKVKVLIPATTTNLGPGFDCLGLALTLYNTVELSLRKGNSLLDITGEGAGELNHKKSNWVVRGIEKVYEILGEECPPVHLKLDNRIPLARGLGSSAAAYLGGLISANELTGRKLSEEEILELAVAHEGHPDNVVPAIHGGLVISCKTSEKTLWVKCKNPLIPSILVAIPDLQMGTKESRAILPKRVAYTDAVYNLTRTALLVSALTEGRWTLLREAMDDRLHQPYRDTKNKLISRSILGAYKAGALGAALSGSGSSIVIFIPRGNKQAGKSIQKIFAEHSIPVRLLNLKMDNRGLRVIKK